MEKTNVMRILDQHHIPYRPFDRRVDDLTPLSVYKTLVTESKSGGHFVFVIPIEKILDLKKAAKAAKEKSISMLKEKDLLALTGYVHGGCSPIGMKKYFPTFFDVEAENKGKIVFSAGKVNHSVEVNLEDLHPILSFELADLTSDGRG